MRSGRLLLVFLSSLAASEPAVAGVFRCDLEQYASSLYEKDGGRWSNRSDQLNNKIELVVTLNDDGTKGATIHDTRSRSTSSGQWSMVRDYIAVTAPIDVGGVTLLSIFRDVDGKRPANYAFHAPALYGGASAFAGFCTAQ